jgi:hypothetical protein
MHDAVERKSISTHRIVTARWRFFFIPVMLDAGLAEWMLEL